MVTYGYATHNFSKSKHLYFLFRSILLHIFKKFGVKLV